MNKPAAGNALLPASSFVTCSMPSSHPVSWESINQVNFRAPLAIPSGSEDLVVSVGAVVSPPGKCTGPLALAFSAQRSGPGGHRV